MAASRRTRVLLAGLVGLLIVSAAAWTLRDRLFGTPAPEEVVDPHAGHDMPGDEMDEMDEAPATTPRAEVQIDARRQQLTGVRTVAVERRPLTRSTRTVGVVRYDETRLADVNLKLSGWIEELFVDYTGRFVEKVMNPYLPGVMKHPQAIEMREGLLHIRDVQGPKKTGSVESRLEAVEQEVFLCKGMVERGLDANHLMYKDFVRNSKEEEESMWVVVSKWIDHLQGQIYDLQCQNLEYEA
jgi:hypothetical protein